MCPSGAPSLKDTLYPWASLELLLAFRARASSPCQDWSLLQKAPLLCLLGFCHSSGPAPRSTWECVLHQPGTSGAMTDPCALPQPSLPVPQLCPAKRVSQQALSQPASLLHPHPGLQGEHSQAVAAGPCEKRRASRWVPWSLSFQGKEAQEYTPELRVMGCWATSVFLLLYHNCELYQFTMGTVPLFGLSCS